MTKSIGVILLAIYLLVVAVLTLSNVTFVYVGVVQGVLAAGAGVCLLLGK